LRTADIFARDDFRTGLISAITPYAKDYQLPQKIPVLYRYSGFSEYAIANLLLKRLSLSMIATFNDCYDSTISFGEIEKLAAQEYEKERLIVTAIGGQPVISKEAWKDHIAEELLAYKNFSSDSYCCCFSETGLSNLMWSHYANNCRGICASYDFERIRSNPLYFSLFPVAYSSVPVGIYDHIHNRRGSLSVEIGVVASAINKSSCWSYEQEWRLIVLNEQLGKPNSKKYISFSDLISAQSVLLGQRFLDNFIDDLNNQSTNKMLQHLKAFADAQNLHKFQVHQVIPQHNTFEQAISAPLSLERVYRFVFELYQNHELTMANRNLAYWSFAEEFLNR